MFGGGGSVVLDSHGAVTGPGGQSVFGDYLAFHYYDASNEDIPYFPTLGIQKIAWVDGWPEFNQTVGVPAITKQPRPVTANSGKPAVFKATATGVPGPVTVWESSSDNGVTWTAAGGKAGTKRTDEGTYVSSLDLMPVTARQDGLLIRAVFRNAHGKAVTEPARLTVTG